MLALDDNDDASTTTPQDQVDGAHIQGQNSPVTRTPACVARSSGILVSKWLAGGSISLTAKS
jgi:hypothetical protein